MRFAKHFFLAFVALFSIVGCNTNTPPSAKLYNPQTVNFTVKYNPDFENILYPSLVLGMVNYQGEDKPSLFSYKVTAPANNSVLRVVMDSSVLNYVTIFQEVLPKKGQTYTFEPLVKWKYENLYSMRQQGVTDLTFTCFINDEEVDIKNLRINYRSVNECLLNMKGKDRKYHDYRWLFSAYVNEDHPYITNILDDIMDMGLVNKFSGYQSGEKAVTEQVFSIWYYLQSKGITYSSISCTSNTAQNATSQHIRFFDEVYKSKQANCIDACVFMASIMRRIGLKPIIFVEPCHAYLGYYLDKNKKNVALLETTMTGWVNFPQMDKTVDPATGRPSEASYNKVSKYLTDNEKSLYQEGKMSYEEMKQHVSRTLFKKASEYQREDYTVNKKNFTDTNVVGFQMLNIEDLRKLVLPIHRDE